MRAPLGPLELPSPSLPPHAGDKATEETRARESVRKSFEATISDDQSLARAGGCAYSERCFARLPNGLVQFAFENIWLLYLVVYIPIRCIEWGIIASFLASDTFPLRSRRARLWILGGIAISILVDLVHPDMIEQGRFCVGRCLC